MERGLERVISILKKQDIGKFDIYAVSTEGYSVEVKDGTVEKIKVPVKKGVAIRVIVDDRLGFAYTRDTSDDGIRIAIECARENARGADPDEYELSMPAQASLDFPLYDENFRDISIERKVEVARQLEEKVRSIDKRVKVVRKASYNDSITRVFYYNSNDHSFSYETTSFSLSVMLKAEENGDSQMGWDFDIVRHFSQLNTDIVAMRAVENAVSLLGAKPMKTRKIPVIFKNVVFAELIDALSAGFLGNNVLRKKSLFAGKLGFEVASHVLSIYDNPHLEDGIGSRPYDDEGTVTRKKAIIERGVLKNFLVDIYSARRLNHPTTGNGIRTGIASLPQPGVTNLVVEPGALSFESLVRTPEEVLVITDAMGIHTINPISGEFSIGVSGLLLKEGSVVQPVVGCTVAGNVKHLLNNISEVGRDSRWIGNISSPSVLVKELTVGGV
ncbi:TldD/PmbA family protein [Desulfurobacterium sp.]|uniref:TldD/PmbA family protein n=1 Tax=Desulfurobacterium sp. TaxID=2004706 RepID=UPI00260F2851|nr:TldD/PmbA family protein [Desulfurobacterium sp.]